MAKSEWTETKYRRFLTEGRGQGVGKEYIPWTKTHEFSSKGRATRILGIKTGRIHHLHSDLQLRAFLIIEWSEKVIDIRESFPLIDVKTVIDDHEELRFDKFCNKETGDQMVITTNFLLTVKNTDGNENHIARTVKNSTELTRKITLEKLEIERRYWFTKGVEWKVITDKQLPRQLAKNIEWVRDTLLDQERDGMEKEQLSAILHKYLLGNSDIGLRELLRQFDKTEGVPKGTGLYLFRYLIAKKEIRIDMNTAIDFSKKVSGLLL
ncbi:TnsA endonuclease C-terminal domain-containing protein [Brevibacillus brevis]|uniref:TnsA endonuclease C-terminal domain-containing protein n=1 Tax=Brevibacillus brevis TaxID=1393 RepID=UPI0037C7C980